MKKRAQWVQTTAVRNGGEKTATREVARTKRRAGGGRGSYFGMSQSNLGRDRSLLGGPPGPNRSSTAWLLGCTPPGATSPGASAPPPHPPRSNSEASGRQVFPLTLGEERPRAGQTLPTRAPPRRGSAGAPRPGTRPTPQAPSFGAFAEPPPPFLPTRPTPALSRVPHPAARRPRPRSF